MSFACVRYTTRHSARYAMPRITTKRRSMCMRRTSPLSVVDEIDRVVNEGVKLRVVELQARVVDRIGQRRPVLGPHRVELGLGARVQPDLVIARLEAEGAAGHGARRRGVGLLDLVEEREDLPALAGRSEVLVREVLRQLGIPASQLLLHGASDPASQGLRIRS